MKHCPMGITAHVDAGKTPVGSHAVSGGWHCNSRVIIRMRLDTRGITIFSKQAELSAAHRVILMIR